MKSNPEHIIDEHPSYGMLCFNRRHGGDLPLFGSSIKHNDIISMTLKHAEVDRHLNSDWYHGNKTIAEVEMSYSQFAEAITSFGMGDGVPVTIRFTEKDGYIDRPDFKSKGELFEQEFTNHIDAVSETAEEAQTEIAKILTKKSLTKTDKEAINNYLAKIVRDLKHNTPFIFSQFNEQMDKTVTEAKNEIEAFTQYRLDSIAKAAIAANPQALLNDNVSPIKTDLIESKSE